MFFHAREFIPIGMNGNKWEFDDFVTLGEKATRYLCLKMKLKYCVQFWRNARFTKWRKNHIVTAFHRHSLVKHSIRNVPHLCSFYCVQNICCSRLSLIFYHLPNCCSSAFIVRQIFTMRFFFYFLVKTHIDCAFITHIPSPMCKWCLKMLNITYVSKNVHSISLSWHPNQIDWGRLNI